MTGLPLGSFKKVTWTSSYTIGECQQVLFHVHGTVEKTYTSADILSALWVVIVLLTGAREGYVSSAAIEVIDVDQAAGNTAALATSTSSCGAGVREAETARGNLDAVSEIAHEASKESADLP